ncbi:MAG: lytic murein transglycosylase [Pseudomonadota bacterium]
MARPHRLGFAVTEGDREAGLDPHRRWLLGGLATLPFLPAAGRPARAETFAAFLAEMRDLALARGIANATIDAAFAGLGADSDVIALDRRQPEGRMTFRTYRDRVVSRARIDGARRNYAAHAALLEEIGAAFDVSPRILVALWGIESSFGRVTGNHAVVRSLATLAHDGRRRDLFTRELLAALEIIDRTPLQPADLFGSWAGAMGQAQFMPTTYLDHAIDLDGDGWADIWHSQPDVFASMANYLRNIGWNGAYRWGREVRRPGGFAGLPTGRDDKRPLEFWEAAGLRRADGGPLPMAPIDAGLILTDDGAGPAYLVYANFDVLMQWNRSTWFALSVGLLSDTIST